MNGYLVVVERIVISARMEQIYTGLAHIWLRSDLPQTGRRVLYLRWTWNELMKYSQIVFFLVSGFPANIWEYSVLAASAAKTNSIRIWSKLEEKNNYYYKVTIFSLINSLI